MYKLNFAVLTEYWPALLAGLQMTVKVSVLSICFGTLMGVAGALVGAAMIATVTFVPLYVQSVLGGGPAAAGGASAWPASLLSVTAAAPPMPAPNPPNPPPPPIPPRRPAV